MFENSLFHRINGKRIVVFGVGIIQADLVGLLNLDISYYVCDMVETTGDVMLENAPLYGSEYLLTERRNDIYIIICENDESYAHRKLESMGFIEGEQFCFGDDLLFEYAHTHRLPKPTRIWGTGATFQYHINDVSPFLGDIRSFILSDVSDSDTEFQGRPVTSFNDFIANNDDFILVCSIYYKDIGSQLITRDFLPGRRCINIRTLVKLIRFASFSNTLYEFDNRSKQAENMVVVLAGYKPLVYESVFLRLKKYVPSDFDVVVVTSGKVVGELKDICARYNWSYASTQRNNVSLALNLAILLFPQCKKIWKIDEDIFVTKGCFEAMAKTYNYIEQNTRYEIGFVTPLLNVNGYGYVRLLELMKADDAWERKFGELRYTDCYTHHVAIHDSPEAAMFMWGKENPALANLDAVADKLTALPFSYSICPIRYSIGFILFSRQDWIRMEMFPVTEKMNLGADEEHICRFCLMHARVIGVAENAVAGHLSYGPQHQAMEKFYKEHNSAFLLAGDANDL